MKRCFSQLYALFIQFICVMVVSSPVMARDVSIVSFEFSPLYYATDQGGYSGLIGETLKRICAKSKLKCSIKFLPIARAYKEYEEGLHDVLLTGKGHERFEHITDLTVFDWPWNPGIYSKKKLKDFPKKEQDLFGYSLIMIIGWQSAYKPFPNLKEHVENGRIKLWQPNDIISAINMLNRDRGDFLWGGDIEFQYYLKKMGMLDGRFNFKSMVSTPLTLNIRKGIEGQQALIDDLNAGYWELKGNGLLDKSNILMGAQLK